MKAKPLTKEDILRAHRHTKSNRAAARYLECSYQHYKPYAKMFIDEESGKSLFDKHLNRAGKGIAKHLGTGTKKHPKLEAIISGDLEYAHFSPDKVKRRLIEESYLAENCHRCGFCERRVTDYKIPLLLNFKDRDKRNYKLDNLELLCYNCYFLYIADVFNPKQINFIEDFNEDRKMDIEKPTFDLSDEMLANMKELGLLGEEDS